MRKIGLLFTLPMAAVLMAGCAGKS